MSHKIPYVALSLAVLAGVVLLYRGRMSDSAHPDKEIDAIRSVLETQQAAWNRGDVEAFMDGYAREDSITFVSGDAITRGWQTVLDRYRKTYNSREKMGTLTFSELEFKPLSEFYIMATGRYELARTEDRPHGRFTLIFRRTIAGWRIIHDHTSSGS